MDALLNILIDVLKFGLPYAMLSLGIFLTYRVLDFADLTCEGSFTLGGAVVAVGIILGIHPIIATILAVISGFLAGIFTGVLHTKLKVPKLLSGIITMTALFSINMVIMGFAEENSSYQTFVNIARNDSIYKGFLAFFDKPNYNIILISLIIVLIMVWAVYWFFGTEIGMGLRATGMNETMAKAQGINTTAMIILGLGMSNALISLSGSMFAQVSGSASNTMGVGTLVIGLASIIIGEAIFGKRSFKNWIISVSLGAVIYYLIIAIALNLGLPNHYLKLLYAILIILVLLIPFIKKGMSKIFSGGKHARG